MNQFLQAVLRDLAPTGKLRAAINYGNPVLVQKDVATGQPNGVSVNLALELARRLDLPIELVAFDAAGRVFEAIPSRVWDVAFLAIDPVRAEEISFTAPYVVIEGTYVVKDDSVYRHVSDLDREAVRIAVGKGAAYDLHLTRTLARGTGQNIHVGRCDGDVPGRGTGRCSRREAAIVPLCRDTPGPADHRGALHRYSASDGNAQRPPSQLTLPAQPCRRREGERLRRRCARAKRPERRYSGPACPVQQTAWICRAPVDDDGSRDASLRESLCGALRHHAEGRPYEAESALGSLSRPPLGWDQIADQGTLFLKLVDRSFGPGFAEFVERKVLCDLDLSVI